MSEDGKLEFSTLSLGNLGTQTHAESEYLILVASSEHSEFNNY